MRSINAKKTGVVYLSAEKLKEPLEAVFVESKQQKSKKSRADYTQHVFAGEFEGTPSDILIPDHILVFASVEELELVGGKIYKLSKWKDDILIELV